MVLPSWPGLFGKKPSVDDGEPENTDKESKLSRQGTQKFSARVPIFGPAKDDKLIFVAGATGKVGSRVVR